MADNTPDDQGLSEAAEARKTIDTLKAELAEQKKLNVQLGQQRHVERFVRSKGVADEARIDAWVDTMMPAAATINFENRDQFTAALEERFGQLIQPVPSPETPPTPQAPAEGVTPPTPSAPVEGNTPGFAQPNPGGAGVPPQGPQPMEYGDPHIQQLVRSGNRQELERLHREGLIAWTGLDPRYGDSPQ